MNSEGNYVVVYLDDCIDLKLSKSLSKMVEQLSKDLQNDLNNSDIKVIHMDKKINENMKIEEILKNPCVREGDVLIIDNQLYSNASEVRLTGTSLFLYVKDLYPYKAVVLITQNDINEDQDGYMYKKYSKEDMETEVEGYYNDVLSSVIKQHLILSYKMYSLLAEQRKTNTDEGEKEILERLETICEGISEYRHITSKDIDNLIKEFKDIEKILNQGDCNQK